MKLFFELFSWILHKLDSDLPIEMSQESKLQVVQLKVFGLCTFCGIFILALFEFLTGHASLQLWYIFLFLLLITPLFLILYKKYFLSLIFPLFLFPAGTLLLPLTAHTDELNQFLFFQNYFSVRLLQILWFISTILISKHSLNKPYFRWSAYGFQLLCLIALDLIYPLWSDPVLQSQGMGQNTVHQYLIMGFFLFVFGMTAKTKHLFAHRLQHEINAKNETLEMQVLQAESQFQSLSNNLNDIYFFQLLFNQRGKSKFVYFSEKAETDLGISLGNLNSDPNFVYQRIHPEDRSQYQAQEAMAISQSLPFEHVARLKWTDGQYRWMKFHSHPSILAEGEILYHGILQNINEEYLFEKSIQESERFLSHLTNNLPDAILTFDHQSERIIHATGSYFNLLGYTLRELKDHKKFLKSVLDPQDYLRYEEQKDILNQGIERFVSYNLPIKIKGNQVRWFNIRDSVLSFGSKGIPKERVIILNDITVLKKSTQALRLSNDRLEKLSLESTERNIQLENFAQIASHNLRAPISNLLSLSQLYQENDQVNPHEILEMTVSTIHKLNDIVNDLHHSLQIKHEMNYHKELIEIEPIVREVCNNEQEESQIPNIKLNFLFERAPLLFQDKELIQQILINLYSNSVKFRDPNRPLEVTFKTWEDKNTFYLSISDNGLGINMKLQERKVFGLHQTFHRHPQAKGLGLYMTNSLMTAVGGSIQIESEEDVGTTFTLQFPITNNFAKP